MLSVPCRNSDVDQFDLTLRTWITVIGGFQYQLPYVEWPPRRESGLHNHRVRVRIDGVEGVLLKNGQEPIIGVFHPDDGPLVHQVIYKVMARSLWGAVRGREQFFNDKQKIVTLKLL